MSAPGWFVWAGWQSAGAFPSAEAGVVWCKRLANDHRRKVELELLKPDVWRYVGPRGRRHGVRLVAYIGTRAALDLFGVHVLPDAVLTTEASR